MYKRQALWDPASKDYKNKPITYTDTRIHAYNTHGYIFSTDDGSAERVCSPPTQDIFYAQQKSESNRIQNLSCDILSYHTNRIHKRGLTEGAEITWRVKLLFILRFTTEIYIVFSKTAASQRHLLKHNVCVADLQVITKVRSFFEHNS